MPMAGIDFRQLPESLFLVILEPFYFPYVSRFEIPLKVFICRPKNDPVTRSFTWSFINMGMERLVCPICNQHPVAINYYRKGRVYYRRACTPCIHRRRRPQVEVPGWVRSGYKKRDQCDRCAFRFKLAEQSGVYYVDGNTANNHWTNLKTICLNCQKEVAKTRWRPSTLQPDF